ncbi:hypothetical protein BD770DRAFT_439343 [Pilaira anomala]|nr:hypothetical protein BD770DRAFT_439343 [Pilaira anomala]
MPTHNLLNIAEILTERLINLIEKESENEDDYSLDLVVITEPMPCTIIARGRYKENSLTKSLLEATRLKVLQ